MNEFDDNSNSAPKMQQQKSKSIFPLIFAKKVKQHNLENSITTCISHGEGKRGAAHISGWKSQF